MPSAEKARARCGQALNDDAPRTVAAALEGLGVSADQCVAQVRAVTEQHDTRQPLLSLKARVAELGVDVRDGAFERFVLAAAATWSLDRLDSQALSASVKALCRDAFSRYADARRRFDAAQEGFVAHCKVATLRRFPAGQFDWEPSGLPRSWVPGIRPLGALLRTIGWVAGGKPGFAPAFFVHMGTGGKNYALLEREAERSYYRMAQSLALQPGTKGLIASSWLHSPDTFAVSPHLAWLNRVFEENGAIVATMGPADPGCGVLHRSPERQRAYDEGRLKPTLGLVIWPRAEMLAWARKHPELQDPELAD